MEVRECPYCHKKVSLRNCLKYILRGTGYPTTCNHCGRELWLAKEPMPFNYCVIAGFLLMYIPIQFCIYYCHMDLVTAVSYCWPIAVIAELVSIILTLRRIYFKK